MQKELAKNVAYQRFRKKSKLKGLDDNAAKNESLDILSKIKADLN